LAPFPFIIHGKYEMSFSTPQFHYNSKLKKDFSNSQKDNNGKLKGDEKKGSGWVKFENF
jgi:hypothetical protein